MVFTDVATKYALHKDEVPEQYIQLPGILKKLLAVSHAENKKRYNKYILSVCLCYFTLLNVHAV